MDKPIIAVDIDEVLIPHFQGLMSWYNNEYGTSLTMAHNHTTDPRPWGTDNDAEAIGRVQRYFETDNFRQEQPFEDSLLSLRRLADSYQLIVITARDEMIEQATREWLAQYFPNIFKDAHFTAQYSLTGKQRSKLEVVKEANVAYFIDDSLNSVLEVAGAGVDSILFGDYPWGQDVELPVNVERCSSWADVEAYFEARG